MQLEFSVEMFYSETVVNAVHACASSLSRAENDPPLLFCFFSWFSLLVFAAGC